MLRNFVENCGADFRSWTRENIPHPDQWEHNGHRRFYRQRFSGILPSPWNSSLIENPQHNMRSYLQLCRLPAVFTALADILMGHLLRHEQFGGPMPLLGLLTASAGLYLGGMVFNDIFDREIDARERPQRPIPSGQVSLRHAVIFGAVLILCGWLGAAAVGRTAVLVVACLTAAVFAYDGGLKKTFLGPLVMGGCRFFNVLLGASGGTSWSELWGMPQVWIAGSLAVYVAGVTYVARNEATISTIWPLLWGVFVVNLGLAGLMGWGGQFGALKQFAGNGRAENAIILLAVIGLSINRWLLSALVLRTPRAVQECVKMLLWSIITLDAAVVFCRWGPAAAVPMFAIFALLGPMLLLRRILIT